MKLEYINPYWVGKEVEDGMDESLHRQDTDGCGQVEGLSEERLECTDRE